MLTFSCKFSKQTYIRYASLAGYALKAALMSRVGRSVHISMMNRFRRRCVTKIRDNLHTDMIPGLQ